jgi:hypothetical protein
MKNKLFRAMQNNSGGYYIGPQNVYIIAKTEDQATDHITNAIRKDLLSSDYCQCCGERWGDAYEEEDVYYGETNVFLNDQFQLIQLEGLILKEDEDGFLFEIKS